MAKPSKTIVILSISSDIGAFLARQYLSLNYRVIGTYRSATGLSELRKHPNCFLFSCDVHKPQQLKKFITQLKTIGIAWDRFISCVGYPLPLTPFVQSDFNEWEASFQVNSLDQLRVFHMLYPLRRKSKVVEAVFFAAGGVNNAVVNFSAYTAAKIMLTKMCEFLDAENPDLNIFIVGPGWTKTKVHQMILKDPNVSKAKAKETKQFLNEKQGTPLEDIFQCINWLCAQGKTIVSGRNFSVVHDGWRADRRTGLTTRLKADSNMYKLRRHKND